jgi:hypothetical protein
MLGYNYMISFLCNRRDPLEHFTASWEIDTLNLRHHELTVCHAILNTICPETIGTVNSNAFALMCLQ